MDSHISALPVPSDLTIQQGMHGGRRQEATAAARRSIHRYHQRK